jgi:hypothetical protein
MSEETTKPSEQEAATESGSATDASRTSVQFSYPNVSQVINEEGRSSLELAGNTKRDPVSAQGKVIDTIRFREALSALYDIVSSDFRYIPKDRTAYLAFQRMRKQSSSLGMWEAQKAYVDWLQRNDPLAFFILDPVISVHPDELAFEVFSKDEGTYAKLSMDWSAFELQGTPKYGTTNIDFTSSLYNGIQVMRSYRETQFSIGETQTKVSTSGENEVLEKTIQVPDSWLRGFLQVQAAGTLPTTSFQISPIDLYNTLRHLRMNADQKKGGRGLRIELIPGEAPRLVLEPWQTVFRTNSGKYIGRTPHVIRIWGRRRLMLIKRLLPFLESIEVSLLGSGLPSFFVMKAGPITFTLGLSGFTSSNWAQAVSFDLLLPRTTSKDSRKELAKSEDKVLEYLKKNWSASITEASEALSLTPAVTLHAMQHGCQQGQLMFDLSKNKYRFRPLLGEGLPVERLVYRNLRERLANDMVSKKGAMEVESENRIHGVGVELTGNAHPPSDKRSYRPTLLMDDEGRVKKAECTCAFYRKHQLKEGPCEHIIGLRLAFAIQEKNRLAEKEQSRHAIQLETRTYTRRTKRGEDVVQLSLNRQRLKMRWGTGGIASRVQNYVFNSVEDAREAYFARLDELETRGYLDATAG